MLLAHVMTVRCQKSSIDWTHVSPLQYVKAQMSFIGCCHNYHSLMIQTAGSVAGSQRVTIGKVSKLSGCVDSKESSSC